MPVVRLSGLCGMAGCLYPWHLNSAVAKQGLHDDNTSWRANVDVGRFHKASIPREEPQATHSDCSREKQSFTGLSLSISCPTPSHHPKMNAYLSNGKLKCMYASRRRGHQCASKYFWPYWRGKREKGWEWHDWNAVLSWRLKGQALL